MNDLCSNFPVICCSNTLSWTVTSFSIELRLFFKEVKDGISQFRRKEFLIDTFQIFGLQSSSSSRWFTLRLDWQLQHHWLPQQWLTTVTMKKTPARPKTVAITKKWFSKMKAAKTRLEKNRTMRPWNKCKCGSFDWEMENYTYLHKKEARASICEMMKYNKNCWCPWPMCHTAMISWQL